MQRVKIGVAGLGIVGSGVVRNLALNGPLIADRSGFVFEIEKIAVRDRSRPRDVSVDPDRLTTDPFDLVRDPEIQIIIELIGGTTVARDLHKQALEAGKAIVTANKALLAEHAAELFSLAQTQGVPLCFEASVAGGIPILKALREGLIANRIQHIHGIINGTCNYILSSIDETGRSFAQALAAAQELGFAEADPTLDIEGGDSMHKACILAALAYGFWVPTADIHVEGIARLDAADFAYAKLLGYTIKLLAVIKAHPDHSVEVHVQPTLVPRSHVLASVSESYNAVLVRGDVVGDTLYFGRGAGSNPTASAVISDLVEAASLLDHRCSLKGCATHDWYAKLKPFSETVSRYYTRFTVVDRPGVLSRIAGVFGQFDIGISSVFQPKDHAGDNVPLIIVLHYALERNLRAALRDIESLDCNRGPAVALRLEDFDT